MYLATLLAAATGALLAWGGTPDRDTTAKYPVPEMGPEVLLVVDTGDPYAAASGEQVRFVLDRVRVPHTVHDLAGDAPLPALDSLAAVLTVAERLGRISDADAARLAAFVDGGGGLASLYRGWSAALAPLFGVAPADRPTFAEVEASLVVRAALMPGEEGLHLPPSKLSTLAVSPQPDCTVLADRQSEAGRAPVAWTCARGAGRTAYWNLSSLSDKVFRGHLLQTLALVHPEHARPVAGWAVMFLDDFASPASNAPLNPIWTEFRQTPAQFYADTWYPDMMRLADDAGLVYTSTVIYAYNARTTPPFRFAEWLNGSVQVNGEVVPYSPWMASVDARVSEQALHGYNHQSLQLSKWPAREPMVQALEAARRRWLSENVAPLPTTYVPPMNLIDSVGVSALREAFPEMRTIAGLYTGRFVDGADREYGPEPWAPELYALPRNTSGFILTPAQKLRMLSLLHTIGGWNHFVHPDEMYSNPDRDATYAIAGLPPPAEIGWDSNGGGMYPAFQEWIDFAKTHYPWLDYVRADEAADRMRAFDALEVAWTRAESAGERRLTVSASAAGQTFLAWARPGESLQTVEGGTVLDVWEGPVLTQVTVRAQGPTVTLVFDSRDPS